MFGGWRKEDGKRLNLYICVYVGATYIPYSCIFFSSPGGRHGLVGLWPFKFFSVFRSCTNASFYVI